jgi:uncharacterized membrane protein
VAAATAFSVDSSATTATVACVVAATVASLVCTGVDDVVEDEVVSSPTGAVVSTGAGVSTIATGEEVEETSGAAEEVEVRYTVL